MNSSQMTGLVIFGLFLAIFPITFAVLPIMAKRRRKRQIAWMTEFAQRNNCGFYDAKKWQRPTFGVRPHGLWAKPHTDPLCGFDLAVEIRDGQHQILGIDFAFTPFVSGEKEFLTTSYDALLNPRHQFRQHLVQIRTPIVPTLLIRPIHENEVDENGDEINPLSSTDLHSLGYRATMKRGTNLKYPLFIQHSPAESTKTGDQKFDRLFKVVTEDPIFARSVLSTEMTAFFLETEWFRIGQVVFQEGSLWTSRGGWLSEAALFEGADHLKMLIDLLPASIWGLDQANFPGFGHY